MNRCTGIVRGAVAPLDLLILLVCVPLCLFGPTATLAQDAVVLSPRLGRALELAGRKEGQPCLVMFTRVSNCERCALAVGSITRAMADQNSSVFVCVVLSAGRRREAEAVGRERFNRFIADDYSLLKESQTRSEQWSEFAQFYDARDTLRFETDLSRDGSESDILTNVRQATTTRVRREDDRDRQVIRLQEDSLVYMKPRPGYSMRDTIVLYNAMSNAMALVDRHTGRQLLTRLIGTRLFEGESLRNGWSISHGNIDPMAPKPIVRLARVDMRDKGTCRIVGYLPVWKYSRIDSVEDEQELRTAFLPFIATYQYLSHTIQETTFLPSQFGEDQHPQYSNCELSGDRIFIQDPSYYSKYIDYSKFYSMVWYDLTSGTFATLDPMPPCFVDRNIGVNGFSCYSARSATMACYITSMGNEIVNYETGERYPLLHPDFHDPCAAVVGLLADTSRDYASIRQRVRKSTLQVVNTDLDYIGGGKYCISQFSARTQESDCVLSYLLFDERLKAIVSTREVPGRSYSYVVPEVHDMDSITVLTMDRDSYILETLIPGQ